MAVIKLFAFLWFVAVFFFFSKNLLGYIQERKSINILFFIIKLYMSTGDIRERLSSKSSFS